MKSRTLTCITAMTLFAALAVPVRLAAQELTAGTGTTNFIPIWTNSTTLGNSELFQTGGKVGIGTTTPAATLNVIGPNGAIGQSAPTALGVTGGAGGAASFSVFHAGAGGGIQLTSGAGGHGCFVDSGQCPGGDGGLVQVTAGNGGIQFLKGGSGGSVKIAAGIGGVCCLGTTGGGGGSIQLAAGSGASSHGGFFGGNGGSITLQPGAGGSGTGGNGSRGNVILAPTGGNVGIGETSPGHTLEIKVGGTTLADQWTIRSSRRFKTNIQPLEGALQKVEQLQGVSYQRKTDGKHEIGVVAEDVAQIVPEVVSRDPETHEVQGVDYSRLAALLIEAVKSQQAVLQSQKAEIQQLKARIEGRNRKD